MLLHADEASGLLRLLRLRRLLRVGPDASSGARLTRYLNLALTAE
ncbi:hypothetical protein ACIRO3_29115 [Streptomyces sp. NPDC102278]